MSSVGERRECVLGLLEGLGLGLLDATLFEVVCVEAEDLVVLGIEVDVETADPGVPIDVHGSGEGDRRREEPLLQQQRRHVLGALATARSGHRLIAPLGEGKQPLVRLGLVSVGSYGRAVT